MINWAKKSLLNLGFIHKSIYHALNFLWKYELIKLRVNIKKKHVDLESVSRQFLMRLFFTKLGYEIPDSEYKIWTKIFFETKILLWLPSDFFESDISKNIQVHFSNKTFCPKLPQERLLIIFFSTKIKKLHSFLEYI